MNKEDIIRMARESGMAGFDGTVHAMFQLEHFAALVAAEEREACAKVCERDLRDEYIRQSKPIQDEVMLFAAISDCASAIRARGQA